MSHSLPNADVSTHLKVVAIALSCAIVVLLVGISTPKLATVRTPARPPLAVL